MKNFYGVKLSSAKIYMRYAISLHIYKYSETRPIMDGFRKNNVNYWAFSKIRSIIRYSLICALKPFFE